MESEDVAFAQVTHLSTHQESGLKANHPASFAVRLNGAQGKLEAKVHSPSGALEECVVTELEKGQPVVFRGQKKR